MNANDLDEMARSYAETALWSSLNNLFGTELCDKCGLRVVECTNSKGAEWRDAVNHMDADCSEGGAHEVADEQEHSEMLDGDYSFWDIDGATYEEFESDCRDFFEANRADLVDMDPGQAGHDFWLTRNHHGAGFWDRGLGDRGERLTKSAHAYGEVDLSVHEGSVYS